MSGIERVREVVEQMIHANGTGTSWLEIQTWADSWGVDADALREQFEQAEIQVVWRD